MPKAKRKSLHVRCGGPMVIGPRSKLKGTKLINELKAGRSSIDSAIKALRGLKSE